MKRLFDLVVALLASIITLPLILVAALMVWITDPGNPFYLPRRIGKDGKPFTVFKIRSMVRDADKSQVDTTVEGDSRLLPVGTLIRRYKIDELPQFWNVLGGRMSLVGPRPNVEREVDLYTSSEREILEVKPGVTDFSSIIFSDLSDRLAGHVDPNIAYNQLIRPWKGRLGVFYVKNHTISMDVALLALTAFAIFRRKQALGRLAAILEQYGAERDLVALAKEELELKPLPPLGGSEIVTRRQSSR